jgi:transposase
MTEREIRDLPWSEYRATVVVELHRVRCPDCGPRIKKVAQLRSKAPFSKRFEEAVRASLRVRIGAARGAPFSNSGTARAYSTGAGSAR